MGERVWLFDTTLRDGAQTQGVSFSLADKIQIAEALDLIGVDYIEGGFPGANPVDDAFFSSPPTFKRARFTAFGMTRRAGRSTENDPGLQGVMAANTPAVCLVGKAWDFHVELALEVSRDENIAMIADSMAHIVARGSEAMFDAEHFFDGYKADPGFALACVEAALEVGARWVVLCDTNGGTLPGDVGEIVNAVVDRVGGERIGIHAHDDTGNSVANSLMAVDAGARQIQGTLNGLGERCGNANLVSVIPTLKLKSGYETGIRDEDLMHLTRISHMLDEILNNPPDHHAPYVGSAAFAHKGGLHVSAVMKDPRTYEHVPPASVGNRRHIVVSGQSGKSNVLARLAEAGIEVDQGHPRLGRLVEEIKAREFEGYSYDGAEASFELLARRVLGTVATYFEVESFRVLVERRHNALGSLVTSSEATVKLVVDGERLLSVAEGNGPVDALNHALVKDLGKYAGYLGGWRLVDYKVRILSPKAGTGAVTRVVIESTDESDVSWSTVGVSANIIDASFQALADSITYKLLRENAPA